MEKPKSYKPLSEDWRQLQPQKKFPDTHALCEKLVLTDERMKEISARFADEIRMGLKKGAHDRAAVKCYPTYVQNLPTGQESGKFLALDFGSQHFRLLLVTLSGAGDVDTQSMVYHFDKYLMSTDGSTLFEYVADCIARFVKEINVAHLNLLMGFTFSFPIRQVSLTKGMLVQWTKGFKCTGVIGKDVAHLLQSAIDSRGDLRVKISAILNDTTGTLVACAFRHKECRIGVVIDKGFNACFLEDASNIEILTSDDVNKRQMIINSECGGFGDNGVLDFIRMDFDKNLDRASHSPGKQIIEKLVSGMYMGEVARLLIMDLVQRNLLFIGHSSQLLQQKWSFTTEDFATFWNDMPPKYNNVELVLEKFGFRNVSEFDLASVMYICDVVLTRSAKLVSIVIATLLNRMKEPHVTIGIDGYVYKSIPKYHNILVENITKLKKPEISFDIVETDDGSGFGAALIAAVTVKRSST